MTACTGESTYCEDSDLFPSVLFRPWPSPQAEWEAANHVAAILVPAITLPDGLLQAARVSLLQDSELFPFL